MGVADERYGLDDLVREERQHTWFLVLLALGALLVLILRAGHDPDAAPPAPPEPGSWERAR